MFSKIQQPFRLFSTISSQQSRSGIRYLSSPNTLTKQSKSSIIFEQMAKRLSFEEFKKTNVKSYEAFQNSPRIKTLYGSDLEKIKSAYEEHCILKYNRYIQSIKGGNPSTMI